MNITTQQLSQLVSKIVQNDQSHLLTDIGELSQEQLNEYYDQLKEIDFQQLQVFKKIIKKELLINQVNDTEIQPIQNLLKLENQTQQLVDELQGIGLKAIAQGELAIITLAGGQGTRLGFDHPKGMFILDLHSKKSLFQIFSERIARLYQLSLEKYPQNQKKGIHWYLMTSKQTDEETRKFFQENNNFGFDNNYLHFFQQGYCPSLDMNGKVLLENKNQIFLSPNGNGGVYEALKNRQVLQKLNDQGVKYVHMVGIDNVLGKLGDPTQLGYMVKNDQEITSKYVQKASPEECVGVHVLHNGKPYIIEYSDLTPQQRYDKYENGKLKFNEGFICNFMCQTSFLNRITQDSEKIKQLLAYHQAIKLVPYYDVQSKQIIQPKEKNANKFELFIFDAFPLANSFGLMEVKREEEFAPIKNNQNNSKVDTPLTALELISKLHRSWLINAGYVIDAEPSVQNVFEVDQTLSYQGENIQKPDDQHKHIKENNYYLKKQ